MLILFAVFALLLLTGSLFPWSYHPGPALPRAAWHVLLNWHEAVRESSVHDVLVNLAIYVPIGFTVYLWDGWRSRAARWLAPVLAGAGLSFAIETLQHYFPPRAPGLVDVVCNAAGTLAGVVLAAVFHSLLESRHVQWRRRHSVHLSSALLLLAIWISASGWPLHTYPLGIVTRLRVLWRAGSWMPLETLESALQWLVAGCLLSAVTGPAAARWWLLLLLPGLHLLLLISPGHGFTWSHLGGALAAALLFWLLPEQRRRASAGLAGLWLAWLVVDGLRPFTLLAAPGAFNWIPFRDLFGASWMPAIAVLLRKTWLYGAAFWLLAHTRSSHGASLGLTLVILGALEAAQCWLAGRAAGLTDPALGLLTASLLWLVDRRFAHPPEPLTET